MLSIQEEKGVQRLNQKVKDYIAGGGSLDELVDELHHKVEDTMEKDTIRELLLEKEAMVLYMDLETLEPY